MGKAIGITAAVLIFTLVLGLSGVVIWHLAEQRARVAQVPQNPPLLNSSPAGNGVNATVVPQPQSPAQAPAPAAMQPTTPSATAGTQAPAAAKVVIQPVPVPAPQVETPTPAVPDSTPPLQNPAISMRASAVSAVVVTPLTLQGFPAVEFVSLNPPGKKFSEIQRSTKFEETMVVAAGTYDLWFQQVGPYGKRVLAAGNLVVKDRQTVEVDANKAVGAIVVRDPKIPGFQLGSVRASKPGKKFEVLQQVTKFDEPMLVEPNTPYDIGLEPRTGSLVIIAQKVVAKAGELVVVGGDADSPAPAASAAPGDTVVAFAAQAGAASAGERKWVLPKYYDQLGLSDEQQERVTRVAEVYNPQINDLKRKIDAMKGLPALGSQVITMTVTLRKLTNDRQNHLNKILSDEQREKLREISGSGTPPATPKQNTSGAADVLNVASTLTDKDSFDRVRRQSRCKVYEVEMRSDQVYTIDLRSKEMDSYLRIEDINGNELADDDDSGSGLDAHLQFRPKTSGKYRVIATTYDAETGAFILTVRARPAPAGGLNLKTLPKSKV
jgi:hypothetical protein